MFREKITTGEKRVIRRGLTNVILQKIQKYENKKGSQIDLQEKAKKCAPLNAERHACYQCNTYIPVSFRFVLAVEFYELIKVANLTDDFMQIIENECI